MFLAHDSLRRPLLVGLLAAGGVGSALAAPADQDFEDQTLGTIANPATINGITYFNNDTVPIGIVNNGDLASLGEFALAFRSMAPNSSTQVGFKTADGSEFKLNSFAVSTGFGGTTNLTIKGYRDNAEVASTTYNLGGIFFGLFDVAANTAWENIDEVRITGADLDIDIDDLDFSPAVAGNTAPAIGNLAGSVAWPGTSASVKLDAGGDAAATDTQLGALNGGQGNWNGAVLRVQRKNNAVPQDDFGMDLPASYSGGGGQITHDGVTIANYSISGGTLTVTFTDVAKPVLTSYVNDVLRSVEYSNSQPAGDAVIEFSLSDGTLSGTADVTVTSDVIYVTNATDTATINPVNGTSFSEAVAIANADSTGSQEIRFLSGFGNSTLTLNAVTVSGDVTVDFNNVNNLTLDGGNITVSAGTTLTVARDVGNIAAIQNVITGAGNLAKIGTSRVTLSGVSTYTGGTTISNGELRVRGSLRETSSLTVASGGYLSGTGSVFFAGSSRTATFQSGSFLIPGDNGTGVLTIFGNLSMAAGSTLWVEIQGTVPGTSYDQLAVFGAVNVTGATLTVDHGYTAAPGDSHTIITNDQMDSIAGAFTGLAEGGTLTANGTVLTASYIGGTGNDFTLTAPVAPANTAPVLTPAVQARAYTENASAVALYPTLTVTDVDSTNAISATATITDVQTGDVLGMVSSGGWSESYSSGVLTISGTGTIASLQTVLRTITYSSTSNDPTFGGTDSTRSIDLRVTDSESAVSNVANAVVLITAVNDPPVVANAISNQSATSGTAFSFQFAANTFSDPDSANTLTYTAQLAGGVALPSWLSFNGANRTFSGTPTGADVGNLTIEVIADDGNGGSASDFFDINIGSTNDAPVIGNLDGDSRDWQTGNLALDAGIVATVSDAELGALNNGNGDWAGASLTVQRPGTALSADVFGFDTTGNPFTVNGANLQAGGLTFATFTNANGVLTVNFTSSGATATTALVQNVLRRITYRNDTPAGDTIIRFTVSDGTDSHIAYVTVNSDTIYITTVTDTSVVDLANGVSFSEAVAIAAADATGSQTLVLTGAFSVPVSLAGSLSINESLTLDTANVGGMSISGGTTITLGGGATLRIKHESGSLTINSTLAGTGSLRKEGGGTLALGSVSNEANMSGGITVAGGTLQVATDNNLSSGTLTLDGGTLSNGTSTMTIDNAISLGAAGGTFNIGGGSSSTTVVLSGVISGSGTLTKIGQSVLQVDGNNTYSGLTSLNEGTLIANHANALGTTAGSTTVSSGATVRLAGALNFAESFTISGTGASGFGALYLHSGNSVITGTVTLDNVTDISVNTGANLTLSGVVGGDTNSSLAKKGGGKLTLSNSGNSVANRGGTVVLGGTLSITASQNLGTGNLECANNSTLEITGSTTINRSFTLYNGVTVNVSGASVTLGGWTSGYGTLTKTGAGTLVLSGNSDSTGGTNVDGGALSIASDTNLPAGALTLAPGTSLDVTGATTIDNVLLLSGSAMVQTTAPVTLSGGIGGPGGLTKMGASSLTLIGNSNYAGATTVSAGTLVNNGSIASSITVASGASLGGGGTSGVVSVQSGGSLAPGPGELTVNGNLQMAAGSTLAVDINSATGYGRIAVNGTVDISGVTLAVTHGYSPGAGAAYTIISNDASDSITGTFSGLAEGATLTAGGNGTQLVATYGSGTGNDFVLTLANTAPTVANAIPNQNATEDSAFNFQFAANAFADADSDPLTYTAQLAGGGSLPSWLSFDGLTRTFSGTPVNADVGTISIDVIANDGNGGTVTDTFNIVIANTNDAPTVANAIPNQNATEDSVFSFQFAANTFNDQDVGDTLTYTAQLAGGGSLPGWLTFNPVTRTFSGTPLNADVGTVSIDVIADDGNGGTVTDTFNITVANTNDAPTVANPLPNPDAMKGSAFNFQFALNTFNDPDVGDTLTYSAQLPGGGGLPAWLSFDPVTRTFSGTPGSDDLGSVSIDVIANDGNSGTVTDTFTITVKNSAPVVTSVDTLTDDGAYKAGDTVVVVVTFDQPVTYTGTPQLTLETGATDRVLNVTNGLPGNSIYFSYLIGAGETSADLDYVSTTALGMNGGSIRNSEDTVANIILPAPGTAGSLGANANIVIDTTAPVITSVVFTPGNYVQGNPIPVTVTFSEAVEVLNPDTPTTAVYGITLIPDHGDDFAAATYLTPTGNTMSLIATVPAGVADADGITPGTELVGGPPLADAAGNLLVLTLNNISGASGVLVDSIAPVVSTPIPDQPLVIGDAPVTIDLTQHFTDIGISPMVFVVLNNSDGSKASASITGNTLTLTGLANGVTDITIRADDNYGGFVVDTFQAMVGTSEPTAVQPVLSGVLNPQNGLFELTVNVTNTTPLPINGMRLHVDFSSYLTDHPSLRLYNATATTAPGIAHVDHPFPVAVNAVVPVKLSFYTNTRLFPEPFAPVLTVETLASSALPDTNGSGVQPRLVELPDGNKLIEFPTEAGKWYRVRYSHDMVNWYDSPVPLQAGANRMQWIDSGPPFTQSPPSSVPSRFYIVNEITAP